MLHARAPLEKHVVDAANRTFGLSVRSADVASGLATKCIMSAKLSAFCCSLCLPSRVVPSIGGCLAVSNGVWEAAAVLVCAKAACNRQNVHVDDQHSPDDILGTIP